MNIFVNVDGKWSVDLTMKIVRKKNKKDEDGKEEQKDRIEEQIFQSTDNLISGAKKKSEYTALNERLPYSDLMKQIRKNIPNYKYRGIELNTVLGILARSIGEVRRLKEVLEEDEHPVSKIKDRVDFVFHRHSFQNEILRLASGQKSARQPHGFISNCFKESYGVEEWRGKEVPLLVENEFSRCLFSIFDLENQEEVFHLLKVFNSDDSQEKELILRRRTDKEINLNRLNDEMSKWSKVTEKFAEKKKENERAEEKFSSFFLEFCDLHKVCPEDFKYGNIMGMLFIKLMEFIGKNHSEWQDYVSALSASKKSKTIVSGFHAENYQFSIKDFAKVYFGVKSYVYGGIYMTELKSGMLDKSKEMKTPAQLGITRESGVLEIHLDLSPEEERKWKQWIDESGVNVFQVGKKGLGYVKKIESFGHF